MFNHLSLKFYFFSLVRRRVSLCQKFTLWSSLNTTPIIAALLQYPTFRCKKTHNGHTQRRARGNNWLETNFRVIWRIWSSLCSVVSSVQSITVTQILDTGDNQQQRYGPISFICLPSPAPFPAFYLTYSRFEVDDSLHIQFSFLNSDDPPLLLRRVIPSHTNAELYELVGFQLESLRCVQVQSSVFIAYRFVNYEYIFLCKCGDGGSKNMSWNMLEEEC